MRQAHVLLDFGKMPDNRRIAGHAIEQVADFEEVAVMCRAVTKQATGSSALC
jgi:hypothetical protein